MSDETNPPAVDPTAPAPKKRRRSMQAMQRRKQAALLVAQGKLADREIAAMMGVTPMAVRNWKAEPEFKVMMDEFSARIVDGAVQSVQERLMADAPTNVTFLKGVRDGDWDDDTKRMALRLRASETLFDRQAPKHQTSDPAVKVVINAQLLGQMVRAVKHDGGTVDAEVESIAIDQLPAPREPEGEDS